MIFQITLTACALATMALAGCVRSLRPARCLDPIPREPTISRRHFALPHDSLRRSPIVVVSLQSADAPNGLISEAQVIAQSLSDPRRAIRFTESPAGSGHYVTRASLPTGSYLLRTLAIGYHLVVDTIQVTATTADSAVIRTYVPRQCNEVLPTMLPNER